MRFTTTLALVAASVGLVAAAPAADNVQVDPSLRLIKTSEDDAGTWVTEDEKFEKYTSKGIGFIDITDITVSLLAAALPSLNAVANPFPLGR